MYETNKYGHLIDFFDPGPYPGIRNKFWQDLLIAPFDVETTGTEYADPDTFRIVQFTAGHFIRPPQSGNAKHEPEDFINLFINPDMAVPVGAMKIHGFYHSGYNDWSDIEKHGEHDLADAPLIEEVWPQIRQFMHDPEMWSAYNHTFDVCALISECWRIGDEIEIKPCVDPLTWRRYERQKMSRNSLWETAKAYGVATLGNVDGGSGALHDARTDIMLLNNILWAMAEVLPPKVYDLMRRQCYLLEQHEEYYYKKYGS